MIVMYFSLIEPYDIILCHAVRAGRQREAELSGTAPPSADQGSQGGEHVVVYHVTIRSKLTTQF